MCANVNPTYAGCIAFISIFYTDTDVTQLLPWILQKWFPWQSSSGEHTNKVSVGVDNGIKQKFVCVECYTVTNDAVPVTFFIIQKLILSTIQDGHHIGKFQKLRWRSDENLLQSYILLKIYFRWENLHMWRCRYTHKLQKSNVNMKRIGDYLAEKEKKNNNLLNTYDATYSCFEVVFIFFQRTMH